MDEDARHGAKSDDKEFTGYKSNSMMSGDGFVTNINATAGNTYDGDVLIPLVDEKIDNSSKTEKVVGDTHYGSADNRFEMFTRGITVVAPFRKDFNPTGLFSQAKFILEETGVTCSAGCRTMISNYNEKEGTTTYFFKKDVCQECSMKEQCTRQDRRTITIGKHYELVKEVKEYNKSQEFKKDQRVRAHIEPKQAELKRFHGLVRPKYWGLSKVNIQAFITGITVNVKRFVKVLESRCYLNLS